MLHDGLDSALKPLRPIQLSSKSPQLKPRKSGRKTLSLARLAGPSKSFSLVGLFVPSLGTAPEDMAIGEFDRLVGVAVRRV